MLLFVLERDVDPGAVGGDLALVDRHVEPADLGHAEVAEALGGGLDGILDRVFPGGLARPDQIRDAVDALVRHGPLSSLDGSAEARPPGPTRRPRVMPCAGRSRYARAGAT